MSKFFSQKYASLKAYVPGEQPKDMQYIKLNTNESPFPPSQSVRDAVIEQAFLCNLYSDPACTDLTAAIAELYSVKPENVLVTNGSDEILNFAFMAFGDNEHPFVFPDITYGFYPVFSKLNGIPYEELPLNDDLTVNVQDYIGIGKNIVIANPNAPTGLVLKAADIEQILVSNPGNIVVVDEAYIDFGGESCVRLIDKYDNLIVTQTFSKSRSLAGARLGFGIANAALIADMNTIKYSTNPYNVNRMSAAIGLAAIKDNKYYMDNCQVIIKNREWTKKQLEALGFEVTDSSTNFLFAKSPLIDGQELYVRLKEMGILIRHFSSERIKDYNRITIGSMDQMHAFIAAVEKILRSNQSEVEKI